MVRNVSHLEVPSYRLGSQLSVIQKETEKIKKYGDQRREIQKLWNIKAKVIPILIGALGTV